MKAKLWCDGFTSQPLITGTKNFTVTVYRSPARMEKETARLTSPYPSLTLSHRPISRQKNLIDLAYGAAQQFVLEGKHKEAIPAAWHALHFSTEVFGSDSVQLIPAYLLLAEASAGECCLKRAKGKGETSRGSPFWFALTIYQGRTSSAPAPQGNSRDLSGGTAGTPFLCGAGEKNPTHW